MRNGHRFFTHTFGNPLQGAGETKEKAGDSNGILCTFIKIFLSYMTFI